MILFLIILEKKIMLTLHQFYRRVAFGLTEKDDIKNPLEDSIKQLSNTNSVSWNHAIPTMLDGIKYVVQIKRITKKVREKEGGGTGDVLKAMKKEGLSDDIWRYELSFRAHNAIHGPSPVLDRFQFFWGNHFPIHGKKIGASVGPYHRLLIRESLTSSFSDLVKNVITSSPMMRYLDNVDNIGESSRFAKDQRKSGNNNLGFNENLARELMELFTISPSSGYTQKDVANVTKILSGWGGDKKWQKKHKSVGDMYGPIVFRKDCHEGGSQTVMGKTYIGGENKLFELIDNLCSMDQCAVFIANKLAIHFISDNPPQAAIEHIRSSFKSSGGNLISIHQATLEAVWKYGEPNKKVTWPEIWLIQAMKILNFRLYPLNLSDDQPMNFNRYHLAINKLGNDPFEHGQPNGYSSINTDWLSPELMDRRTIIALFIQNMMNKNSTGESLLNKISFSIPDSQALKEITSSQMDPNALVKILCHRDFIRI
jgi:uncharacterized protein (DUF1800 family)